MGDPLSNPTHAVFSLLGFSQPVQAPLTTHDVSPWTFRNGLGDLLSLLFSPADSSGQLCDVVPAQDEEPQACPDEFEDFVTFEASGFHGRADRGSDLTPLPLYTLRSASHSGPLRSWCRKWPDGQGRAGLIAVLCTLWERGHCGQWVLAWEGLWLQQVAHGCLL